jgi:putative Holliday junction resolvase
MSKIVALDFGLKRIGVAITDDLNIIASALDTVSIQNIVPFLKKIIEINDIKTIVVGQQRQKDYSPTFVEKQILKFIDVIKNKFPNVSLERYDERYTSLMAKKVIIKSGVSKSKSKDNSLVDKIRATIILKSYLENLKKLFYQL